MDPLTILAPPFENNGVLWKIQKWLPCHYDCTLKNIALHLFMVNQGFCSFWICFKNNCLLFEGKNHLLLFASRAQLFLHVSYFLSSEVQTQSCNNDHHGQFLWTLYFVFNKVHSGLWKLSFHFCTIVRLKSSTYLICKSDFLWNSDKIEVTRCKPSRKKSLFVSRWFNP